MQWKDIDETRENFYGSENDSLPFSKQTSGKRGTRKKKAAAHANEKQSRMNWRSEEIAFGN